MRHAALIAAVEQRLALETLADVPVPEIIPHLCERLRKGGVAVSRVSIGWRLLHPLYRAEDFTWDLHGDAAGRRFMYGDHDAERYRKSPLHHVLTHGIEIFRRRLCEAGVVDEFELFAELAQSGHTDYLMTLVQFGTSELTGADDGSYSRDRGVFISFCSDARGGFDDDEIALLTRLRHMIAIAARSTISAGIATAIATTYLGRRAGSQVLAGSIRRGDGEIIPAVIWYSDLRSSTALSERLEPSAYVEFLNRYFEATAGAVTDADGEVLDFIGDGVLAIFPQDDGGLPRALEATEEALARLDALARSRPDLASRPAGLASRPGATARPAALAGIAVAVGDVVFGNIGIPDRLTFSVIGTTVNSVARIEKLTKELGERVLVTAPVAAADPERWESRGRFDLDGMREPVELFALAPSTPLGRTGA